MAQSSSSDPKVNELISLAMKGNVKCFEELVRRYVPGVIGYLRHFFGPTVEVEDLAQETFLRAFRYLKSYDQKKSFATWLFSIARHLYLNEWKKNKREKQALENLEKNLPHSVEDTIVTYETAQEILGKLSQEGKFLIHLRIFLDLSFSEMAEILEEEEGTVRVRFHRLLAGLQRTHQPNMKGEQ